MHFGKGNVIVLSHVFVGVTDFDRAMGFYEPLMAILGRERRFIDRDRPWAGWQSAPSPRPLFLIGVPYNGKPHEAGNGQMIALTAKDRVSVDRAWEAAMANGGTDEGKPGLRPQYHADYYGAYFRDPDGNKLCVVCHTPASGD